MYAAFFADICSFASACDFLSQPFVRIVDDKIFELDLQFENAVQQRLFNIVKRPLERLLAIPDLNDIHARARAMDSERRFTERVLDAMSLEVILSDEDRSRIPSEGAVVAVSNHPFGGIEGVILGDILRSVRPDAKLMANFILERIPEMRDLFIFVDPFNRSTSPLANRKALRQTLQWLKDDHMLGVFPAGMVAHFDLKNRQVTDPEWATPIGRMIQMSEASVLPVYFDGHNGPLFQLLGMIHPRLRTALLPREMANKKNQRLEVRVGHPITSRKLQSFDSDDQLVTYLRRRTYTLANREERRLANGHVPVSEHEDENLQPIVAPRGTDSAKRDIQALPDDHELATFKELSVYYARADSIPNIMHELGRLREITFRQVGEGTGTSIDIDDYDENYVHLFLWNHEKEELVGAYRFGQTDYLMDRFGIDGLYTSTLFQYKQELLSQINPALEMGRAFVRSEYQGSYRPLLLLWKGIGAFVVRNPRYRYLFGPVSINNEYQSMSHQLMVQFLQIHNFEPELADLVEPRTPFRIRPIKAWDTKALSSVVDDVNEVSSLIDDIETKQRGIPVLLKQYLKLGGKLLGFYVDPDFSNVVGGLILVDLLKTDRSILNRYMGKEKAESFLMHHNAVHQ